MAENRDLSEENLPRRKKKKKRVKRSVAIVLAVLLVLSVATSVIFAAACFSISEKYSVYKEKFNDNNTEIGDLKTRLAEAINGLSDAKAQLDALNEKVSGLQAEKEALEQEKSALESENADLKAKAEKTSQTTDSGKSSGGKTSSGDSEIGDNRVVYLTFDDGVSSATPELIEILNQCGVKATFFVTWKESLSDYYKLIVENGHAIGNHSSTHEWKNVYSSLSGFKNEVNNLSDHIYELTGYKMTLFRFPGGSDNTIHKKYTSDTNLISDCIDWVHSQGYSCYDWTINSLDAESDTTSVQQRYNAVVNGVIHASKKTRPLIILMHDGTNQNRKNTRAALPDIIRDLKAKGFTFEVLTSDVREVWNGK